MGDINIVLSKKLKCKEWDSFVSLLGRMLKIGDNFIMINGMMIASKKSVIGKTTIVYPFFTDDQRVYEVDGIYKMNISINQMYTELKDFESDKEKRKEITINQSIDKIFVRFSDGVIYTLFTLTETPTEEEYSVASNVKPKDITFDILNECEIQKELTMSDLIMLRDGCIYDIEENAYDAWIQTRIAKSLYQLAGSSRLGTPIALESKIYISKPQSAENLSMLTIYAKYSCTGIEFEAFHQYIILIY